MVPSPSEHDELARHQALEVAHAAARDEAEHAAKTGIARLAREQEEQRRIQNEQITQAFTPKKKEETRSNNPSSSSTAVATIVVVSEEATLVGAATSEPFSQVRLSSE